METQYKIFSEFDELLSNYEVASMEKIDGLYRSQAKVIKMCEYYSDSKYLGSHYGNVMYEGSKVSVPFYNIVNYRVELAKTATDLDTKDIEIISDNPKHQVHSMLLNREAFEWMKESGFSLTLNQMGYTRPKYGGYLVKKVEEDGDLKIDIVKWTNVTTDQNDILGGAITEEHHMTPVELMGKSDVWENTEDVLRAHKKIKSTERPNSISVYEITGEFPNEIFLDSQGEEGDKDDEFEFSLQRYFMAGVDGIKFLLYSEQLSGEMTDYYEYLSWEDNGYGLGRGVIEDSEEAQIWTNDAVINESIAMDLAGRVGIKTTSKKIGNNILEHDHGKIYELEVGADMSAFNLAPSSLGQYQNQIDKWKVQADNVTSSYEAATGEQPPSGTPYSTTALLNAVATKPFDYKREEWGIHLTKIWNNWVIPYLIKKLKKEHILVSEFSEKELEVIDESFANFNANRDLVQKVLNREEVDMDEQGEIIRSYKDSIKKQGKKRFIEIPKDYFKDVEPKISVITTGEQINKAAVLQSLSQIMRDVISSFNPQTGEFAVLEDEVLSGIFNQLVEIAGTGISPISLGRGASPTVAPAQGAPPTQAPTAPPATQTNAPLTTV